jgi:hypothetical protein
VTRILKDAGLNPIKVELGTAILPDPISPKKREELKPVFEEYGFELLDDKRMRIIERES